MKKTVLLGDSITEWNPMKTEEILNLGIAGNTTEDIWKRIDQAKDTGCRKVIFKAGINDVLKNFSLEKSQNFYKKISCVLKNEFEEVVFLSVLPIVGRKMINRKVRKLNSVIEEITLQNNFEYRDVHHLFCDEELNLKNDYSTDGIHLSVEGYKILNAEIYELLCVI